MKKIIGLTFLLISLICISGCVSKEGYPVSLKIILQKIFMMRTDVQQMIKDQ